MFSINLIIKYLFIVFKYLFYKKGEQLDITKDDFDMWKFTKFVGVTLMVSAIIVLGYKLVNAAKANIKIKEQLTQCVIDKDKITFSR